MLPDNLFFTADLHLGHENIIDYCSRPFADVASMHEEIIRRWNAKVPKNGETFILGDISMKIQASQVVKLLRKLNGQKYLVAGNHDQKIRKSSDITQQFVWIKDYHEVTVQDHGKKQTIVMSHYPMLTWHKRGSKSWMLHGHCHGTLSDYTEPHRLDVGVDAHNFAPLSYDEVKSIICGLR